MCTETKVAEDFRVFNFISVLLDTDWYRTIVPELIENHFVSQLLRGWGLSEIQRDGNERIGAKIKTWGEG